MSACFATCAADGWVVSEKITADAEVMGARLGLRIPIAARPDCATADTYVSAALQPDVEPELFFPSKVASSGEIIFIKADATEDTATTVVAGQTTVEAGFATFDVPFGRGGGGGSGGNGGNGGSGGGSGGMSDVSLPREANSARYSSVMVRIVDDISDNIIKRI